MSNRAWKIALVLTLSTLPASLASAQQPRYVPPMGNVAPSALNLFRFDSRSARDLDGFAQRSQAQAYQIQNLAVRQQSDFRATQQSIAQLRAVEASATGVGAGFMNHSHYYPMRTGGARAMQR